MKTDDRFWQIGDLIRNLRRCIQSRPEMPPISTVADDMCIRIESLLRVVKPLGGYDDKIGDTKKLLFNLL